MNFIKILIFIFLISESYSQTIDISKKLYGKDFANATRDSTVVKIQKLITNYQTNFFNENIDFRDFWTKETTLNTVIPDNLLRLTLNQYYDYSNKFTIGIDLIDLYKKGDYWIAQLGFNLLKRDTLFSGLISVLNYGVKIENNEPKLFRLIDMYPFHTYKSKKFTYYEDTLITNKIFNTNSFEFLINENNAFFELILPKITCYLFENNQTINESMGFLILGTNSFHSGERYDVANNTIYIYEPSNFKHELIHAYLVEKFGGNCHPWMNEGCATFLAGSILTLEQHLTKINKHIIQHTEINLSNFFNYSPYKIDSITNYKYSISGLLCKLIYVKHGKSGLFKFLNSGQYDNDCYKSITELLGVKQENLNSFLRTELNKY